MFVRTSAIAIVALGLAACGSGEPRTAAPTPTPSPTPTVTITTAPPPSTSPPPSSPAAGWDALFTTVGPSVVRLAVATCDAGLSSGSGFVVAPDLVMTAAHVVDGARTVSVQTEGGQVVEGYAVGADPTHDVALVRLDRSLSQPPLTLESALPSRGSEIAVIGYPFGVWSSRISTGITTGLPEPLDYGDQQVERAFTTDAAVNGGNSGGPAFNHAGLVVGLVSGVQPWQDATRQAPAQGTSFLIPGEDLAAALQSWRGRTTRIASPCPGDVLPPEDEGGVINVRVLVDDPDAFAAASVLHSYGLAITMGAYTAAYNALSPAAQAKVGDLASYSEALSTTLWEEIEVTKVVESAADHITVDTVVRTTQDAAHGANGHTCSIFTLRYRLVWLDGELRIDLAKGAEQACTT